MAHTGHTAPPNPPAGGSGHVCYFQMIQGGMACSCGETITAIADDLSRWVTSVRTALRDEGITGPLAERVINRLAYGDPLGHTARYKLSEDERDISVTVAMSAPLPVPPGILVSAVREYGERMGRVNGR